MITRILFYQGKQLHALTTDISDCRKKILAIIENTVLQTDEDVARVRSYVHVLRIFETEMVCHLEDWTSMMYIITVRLHCLFSYPAYHLPTLEKLGDRQI